MESASPVNFSDQRELGYDSSVTADEDGCPDTNNATSGGPSTACTVGSPLQYTGGTSMTRDPLVGDTMESECKEPTATRQGLEKSPPSTTTASMEEVVDICQGDDGTNNQLALETKEPEAGDSVEGATKTPSKDCQGSKMFDTTFVITPIQLYLSLILLLISS